MGTGRSRWRQGSSVPGKSKFSEVLGSMRYACVSGGGGVFEQMLEQKARAGSKKKSLSCDAKLFGLSPEGNGGMWREF